MKYLFLLYGEPIPEAGSPEARKLYDDWSAANQAMAEAGVLISCGPLHPPEASTTVQVRGGETLLTDGPAAEIKEQFGGYTLVECAHLDEALTWAAAIPTASSGMVEVRPVVQVQDMVQVPDGEQVPDVARAPDGEQALDGEQAPV